jgi:peroxidase
MWAYLRKGQSQRTRARLSLEQLEVRQLMAADLLTDASSLFRNPIPTTPSTPIVAIRTIDGTGNNLLHWQWGSTNEELLRIAAAEYGDGVYTLAGADRPSARVISNTIAAQDADTELNDRNISAYIYVFGQLLDHDLDLTTTGTTSAGIAVPKGDEQFDPNSTGTQYISFSRSNYSAGSGTSTSNPREQTTDITSWIDASMVYGSDKATADSLRTFIKGQLKTSAGNLPSVDAQGNFLAGDIRANENIELTSMQTLFLREHNRIAAQLARDNPTWTDEQIYQQARARVGAEIQVITYKEFLPALLGQGALTPYRGYNASVDPSISNEFSTAAFRLHTLINDDVEFFGNDGRAVRDEVALREAFFNPALLRETGIDNILKYTASTLAQEDDNQIVDSLRNFLFGAPGQGGLDLASLNIQRGRDHGLADYNAVRKAYGLTPVTSFSQISSDPEVQQKLQSLYGSVDNIDLWVGLLSEDHVRGASVGQTAKTIIADQFQRLRDGDRFWYQRVFSGKTLSDLEQTTLADIIQRNTTIKNLQDNVFVLNAEISGQVYYDANGSGRLDRFEPALPGVKVELLNDEGVVVDTTTTNRDGRYRFTSFAETGDYQVRVVLPTRYAAAKPVRDVLISRGGLSIGGMNFALTLAGRTLSSIASDTAATTSANATDAALTAMSTDSATQDFGSLRTRMNRSRIRSLA